MSAYEESNMSEAARRAYEAARRAFSDAPSVPAHGWRGTLEARAAAAPATDDATGAGAAAMPQMSPGPAAPAPSGTLRERIDAARAKQAGSVPAPKSASGPASDGAPNPFARAENEDDDGYDPWSDRREEPSFWEEDPWR